MCEDYLRFSVTTSTGRLYKRILTGRVESEMEDWH